MERREVFTTRLTRRAAVDLSRPPGMRTEDVLFPERREIYNLDSENPWCVWGVGDRRAVQAAWAVLEGHLGLCHSL